MSIYRRLLLWFCAANLATLAASILIAHAIFERSGDRPPNVDRLRTQVELALRNGEALPEDRPEDGRRWLLLRDGRPLDNRPLPGFVARNLPDLNGEDAELRLRRGTWLVSRRLESAQGPLQLVVLERPMRRKNWARWLTPALQVVMSLLAIGAVGWIVARHLIRPLERIQSAVQRVAAGELSSRVGDEVAARRDEYGRLASDFDRMAAQIETLVQNRDRLLHDVSHELRAPLSRLRFALELAREDRTGESLERADREIARIDALVGELLALARLDQANADRGDWPQIDVGELAREVADAERPQALRRRIAIEVAAPLLRAAGDRESLMRALENVLRNALRHSPDGGAVRIEAQEAAGDVLLRVTDAGAGVAPEDQSRLFEPFFRGREMDGVEGYGLGLAIVARVMRAHRGLAQARNRESGGLEVSLRWPRERPAIA